MNLKRLLTYLECLSFLLWIVFTMFSIALAGLGLEGILVAAFMVTVSSTEPIDVPLAMASAGGLGVSLSILWRRVGVDHFHYLEYDSPTMFEGEGDAPCSRLKDLILEVENSAGYARNEVRARAKTWLINHASAMDEEDIQLAKAHFGYLLPADWAPISK